MPSADFESSLPFDLARIEAAAVYCSDGRFGSHVDDLLQNELKLPRYDRLAIPGGSACLTGHFLTHREEEGLEEQLRFLIVAHKLRRVVLIAHQDCAYYTQRLGVPPAQLERQQRDDLQKAIQRVSTLGPKLLVEAFFARKTHQNRVRFEKCEVTESGPDSLGY
ncbi:MAG: hypothetical protein K8T91_03230 [Planctomycetes bacterium]|nr:hypothetical protein [Planctomycetota bacterium]